MSLGHLPHHHHHAIALGLLFCAWVSLWLILRMWRKHTKDSSWKKLGWSCVLCVPFLGWVFYGAFYVPLSENEVKAPLNKDAFYGG